MNRIRQNDGIESVMVKRVVIAGGGVAALEAALALRSLAKERVAIELFGSSPISGTGRSRSPSRSSWVRRTGTSSARSQLPLGRHLHLPRSKELTRRAEQQ